MEHARPFYGKRYRRGIKQSSVPAVKSKVEKEVEEHFSQPWQIYRVATHKLGGLHLISEFNTCRTLKDLYDMLEIIDVYDSFQEEAHKAAIQDAANKATQNKK
ncbi:MAG: hypothetical protein Tp178MES00d2C33159851_112 [Prokaryotic dsDNA virus sp.]|nr:MAG: hypothetical protein Tp178MES00d2C33159851_112 [Prokaryotic dsDNA virus sp.]